MSKNRHTSGWFLFFCVLHHSLFLLNAASSVQPSPNYRQPKTRIIHFEQVCELGPNELLFFFVIGYLPRSKYGPLMYATVMGGRTPHHEVMTAGDTTTGATILPTTPPPPLLLDPSNRRSATRSESKDLYHRPNTTTVRDSLRGNAPLRCDFNTIELPWWW